MIKDLYLPIKGFFNLEEAQEMAEIKEVPENEMKIMFNYVQQALSNEGMIMNYIRALSYDFEGKDLMFVIISELYSYLKGQKNYHISQWNLCREFEKLIKYE
jgi:hypothetical protein